MCEFLKCLVSPLSVMCCILFPTTALSGSGAIPISDTEIQNDQILIAASLTDKLLADEAFIRAANQPCTYRPKDQMCTSTDEDPILERYCKIRNRLKGTSSGLSGDRAIMRDLLVTETTYRLRLRSRCLPFWGGITTRTPGIPNVSLQEMGDLLAMFEALAEEIRWSQQITSDLYAQAARDQASIAATNTRREVSRIEQRQARFNQQVARRDRDRMLDRISNLEQIRENLSKEVSGLIEQQEKTEAAVQAAIIDGLGQALGLPPNFQEIIEDGSLDTAALAVAERMLEGQGAGAEFLSEYQDDIRELTEAYQQIKETGERIEQGRKTLEAAADAFRKGQFDQMLKSGILIYEQVEGLPVGYTVQRWRDELRQVVEVSKPVQGLLSIAEYVRTGDTDFVNLPPIVREKLEQFEALPDEIKQATIKIIKSEGSVEEVIKDTLELTIENALEAQLSQVADEVGDEIENIIWPEVKKIFDSLREAYVTILQDPNLGARERRVILNAVFRTYPDMVIGLIEECVHSGRDCQRAAAERALQLMGFRDTVALHNQISTSGLTDLGDLYVRQEAHGQDIQDIYVEVGVFDPASSARHVLFRESFATIAQKIGNSQLNQALKDDFRSLAAFGESLLETFDLTVRLLEGRTKSYLEKLLDEMSASEVASIVRSMAKDGQLDPNSLWQSIIDEFGADTKDKVFAALAGIAGSQQMFKIDSARRSEGQTLPRAPARGGPSASDAQAQAMVTLALDAAFPGAGTAFNVATSVLSGMAEMSDLGDQIKKAVAEIKRTYLRQAHLMELAIQASDQIELAQFADEIAEATANGAAREFAKLNEALEIARDQQQRQLFQIDLRKPLAYYIMERLRETYDALDRSLALWLGELDRPSGLIAQMVENDPSLIRLAIDSDIHLYDWLNRKQEQSRADLEAALAHWRQLYQLSKDICRRRGCMPGNARLGETSQTRMMPMSELLTDMDLRRFRQWQSEKSENTLRLPFLIGADWSEVRVDIDNIRVIDVRLGIEVDGGIEVTPHLTLMHPGTAFILKNGKPETEALVPVVTSGFDNPADRFNIASLRNRWNIVPSRRPLEGYGLMTDWTLGISPSDKTHRAEDIMIRFAFHYNEPRNLSSDQDYLVYLDFADDDLPANALAFTRRQLLTLGKPDELAERLREIDERSPTIKKPPIPCLVNPVLANNENRRQGVFLK